MNYFNEQIKQNLIKKILGDAKEINNSKQYLNKIKQILNKMSLTELYKKFNCETEEFLGTTKYYIDNNKIQQFCQQQL